MQSVGQKDEKKSYNVRLPPSWNNDIYTVKMDSMRLTAPQISAWSENPYHPINVRQMESHKREWSTAWVSYVTIQKIKWLTWSSKCDLRSCSMYNKDPLIYVARLALMTPWYRSKCAWYSAPKKEREMLFQVSPDLLAQKMKIFGSLIACNNWDIS